MSHNLYAIVVRSEDIKPSDTGCFIKLKKDGFSIISPPVALKHKVDLSMRRVQLMTDYFGGSGEQEAAYFDDIGRITHFHDRTQEGAINAALSMLGVSPDDGLDNFDTIGLGKYRSNQDLLVGLNEGEFEEYEDRSEPRMVHLPVEDYNEVLGGLEDLANWVQINKDVREKNGLEPKPPGEAECEDMAAIAKRILKLVRKGVMV